MTSHSSSHVHDICEPQPRLQRILVEDSGIPGKKLKPLAVREHTKTASLRRIRLLSQTLRVAPSHRQISHFLKTHIESVAAGFPPPSEGVRRNSFPFLQTRKADPRVPSPRHRYKLQKSPHRHPLEPREEPVRRLILVPGQNQYEISRTVDPRASFHNANPNKTNSPAYNQTDNDRT